MDREIVPGSLDLFSPPPTLLSINEFDLEKIQTKTTLDGTSVQQLEFTAGPDKLKYTDLNESFFMLKCKYLLANRTALGDTPTVGPVQIPLTSIFKSMDMWMNDVKVTPTESNMHYIHFLRAFTQSNLAKNTYLTLALWYEDTYEKADDPLKNKANQPDPQQDDKKKKNEGLKKRADFFGGSKEVVLIGRLFIPPHNCTRYFPPNIKFDWRFELAPMNFFTMTDLAEGHYRFAITEAAILLRRVKVSPSVALAHNSLLQTRNAIFPCKYMLSRTYNIPAGYGDFNFENAFIGKEMPTAIFIMFVKSKAKNGDFKENPYLFWNVNLLTLTIRLGGKKVPAIEYKLDVDEDQTQFALWQTYLALDYIGTNSGPGNLNRNTMTNGAFIYGIDLSRDGMPNAGYPNSNFDASTLSIEGSFKFATDDTYTVMALGLFNGQIEINKYYIPLTSYA